MVMERTPTDKREHEKTYQSPHRWRAQNTTPHVLSRSAVAASGRSQSRNLAFNVSFRPKTNRQHALEIKKTNEMWDFFA